MNGIWAEQPQAVVPFSIMENFGSILNVVAFPLVK